MKGEDEELRRWDGPVAEKTVADGLKGWMSQIGKGNDNHSLSKCMCVHLR